jgi:ABC-2 type transport system ATP-binding protein
VIEVKGLTKRYGDHVAIRDLSFEVQQGDILGFLGPNGAGKTSTMRILSCYFPPTAGTAKVAGFDVFDQSLEVRRRVGYLPENPPLYTEMSVRGYLKFAARIKDVPAREVKKRVDVVVDQCRLEKVATRQVGQLSKGFRQRVGLAQALIHDPPVLILDEPTSGLDPAQIIEVRQLVRGLAEKHTVILSTHILPEVSQICRSVIIINEGRIVAHGTPENLVQGVQTPRRLELKLRGDASRASSLLDRVAGVHSVRDESGAGGVATLLLEYGADADPREEVARQLVQNGFGLLEMSALGVSLEDLYLRLVSGSAVPGAEEPEAALAAAGKES